MDALAAAKALIDAGAPVFVAKRCAPDCRYHRGRGSVDGYDLPTAWHKTPLGHHTLAPYAEGDALAMVTGHALDVLDVDPRNGGAEGYGELAAAGAIPRVFGHARTPSGGDHFFVSGLGVRKGIVAPGVDLQSGVPAEDDVRSSGFVFIGPTARPSKGPVEPGVIRTYEWVEMVDPDEVREWAGIDDSGDTLRTIRLAAESTRPTSPAAPRADDPFGQPESLGARSFTHREALAFLQPAIQGLIRAPRGGIEEAANTLAAAMSHFVPALYSADQAYAALVKTAERSLDGTWRDGVTGWSIEKFRAVLDGRRPPLDNWKAELREETPLDVAVEEAAPAAGLRAKLVRRSQFAALPKSEYLIKGVLNLNSESWLIGAPGGFKSFVAIDWACHVAIGQEWNGRRIRGGPVLYVAAEGGAGLERRVQAWEAQHDTMVGDNLILLPEVIRPVVDERGVRGFSADWNELCAIAAEERPSLIVLDTQARLTIGLEENSNSDMSWWTVAVGRLRQASGACVLVVHHTGRDGKDARGASAIDGAQDMEWKVERRGRAGDLTAELRCEKNKDGADDLTFPLTARVHTVGADEDGDPITSLALTVAPFEADPAARFEEHAEAMVASARWAPEQERILRALAVLSADGAATVSRSELLVAYNALREASGQKKIDRSNFNSTINRMEQKEQDQEELDETYQRSFRATPTRVELIRT